jgi:hypothetical protein
MENEIDLLLNSLRNINCNNIVENNNNKKELIELTDDILFSITSYKEVCYYLNEKEEICLYKKLKQIERLFNGDWKANKFNSKQKKYYPYFAFSGGGLGFHASTCDHAYFLGQVAYFKDEKTATFVGKTFIKIYEEL